MRISNTVKTVKSYLLKVIRKNSSRLRTGGALEIGDIPVGQLDRCIYQNSALVEEVFGNHFFVKRGDQMIQNFPAGTAGI